MLIQSQIEGPFDQLVLALKGLAVDGFGFICPWIAFGKQEASPEGEKEDSRYHDGSADGTEVKEPEGLISSLFESIANEQVGRRPDQGG